MHPASTATATATATARTDPRHLPGESTRTPPRVASALARMTGSPWSRAVALLALLLATVWAGLLPFRTPSPVPVSAPATTFSADRAMTHLTALATESRATGTPGHDAAQTYLIDQLGAMGLAPERWTAPAVLRFEGSDTFETAMVTNVIARIPGTESTGAIALNAHYDSGDTGPGASDCGSCLVTVLESVRALLAGPVLRNDVIIVFSDAEEHGDLGANAFNRAHPWAADVRLALNYEAQGTGGPALLYATSNANGWLTQEFLRAAPDPRAYSLFPQIVRLFAGQRLACDLQDYLSGGAAGLGFVYAGDPARYHTAEDSVANIDRGSLQQEGAYTLALVRHFGQQDLSAPPSAPDRVFFNLLPGVVLHYPGALVLPLAAAITLLCLALVVIAWRRDAITARGMLAAAAAFVLAVLGATALTGLVWQGLRSTNDAYRAILVGNYAIDQVVIGLSLLSLGIMAALLTLLRRWIRPANLTSGALLIWTLLLWPVSLAAPGASYLVAWPLLFGMLPLVWIVFVRDQSAYPWRRVALLAVAAVPALLLLPMTAYQVVALIIRVDLGLNISGSVSVLGVWALFVAPIAGLLVPHLHLLAGEAAGARRWLAPAGLLLAAALAFAGAGANAGFSVEQPRPSHVAYELNADSGAARLVSIDEDLNGWTAQLFTPAVRTGSFAVTPAITADVFELPLGALALPAPTVALRAEGVAAAVRTLDLLVTSPRGAPLLDVVIHAPGEIVGASVNGMALDLTDYPWARDGELTLLASGVGADGVPITLQVRGDGPVSIELTDTSYGLPAIPALTVLSRLADVMPAPALPRDATIVRATVRV